MNRTSTRGLTGAAAASEAAAWIGRTATAIATTDPAAPLDDLDPLRTVVGGAEVAGLGEWTHGSREQFRIKHRMVRFLVERMGFRTVAFEMDFAHGIEVDRYVRTGEGDPAALMRGMANPLWKTREILDLVEWIAAYNRDHPGDPVRFFGADMLQLRPASFAAITDEVRAADPGRLDELEDRLDPVRPRGWTDIPDYQRRPAAERRVLIGHARAALDLVLGLPAAPSRTERALAEQHARAVLAWYEYYAVEPGAPRPVREAYIADAIGWWQRLVGGRTAYWAANVHTAAAPAIAYAMPGESTEFTYAGGLLRRRMGPGYASIGTVVGEGVVNSRWAPVTAVAVGPPAEGLLDAVLGAAGPPDYLLDLRAPAPEPVREWREGPTAVRMVHPVYAEGEDASDYVMTADSLAGAFDAVVRLRSCTPSTLLA